MSADSEPGGRKKKAPFLDQLLDRWQDASRKWRRIAYLVLICLALFGLAFLVAALTWKGDVSRQGILVVAFLLMGIAALLLLGAGGWRSFFGIAAVLAGAATVAGATINAGSVLPDGPAPRGAVVGCPGLPKPPPGQHYIDGTVAETVFGYAHLREAAGLENSPIDLRYPTGCELAFSSWCIGQPKSDWRFHVPDPVWLKHVGAEGYVAAADLKVGEPPEDLRQPCPGAQQPPRRPEITSPLARRLTGPVEFTVAAPHAVMVGFAGYYEDVPGRRQSAAWHPLGLDDDVRDGVTARWDTRAMPGQSQRGASALTIAAVPCLGLEVPAESLGTRSYVVANRGGRRTAQQQPDSLAEARQLACANSER